MDYTKIITVDPQIRNGKPCIRGMRISVGDVLEYLAGGMSHAEILEEFPYLTEEDIRACLAFAADRERHREAAWKKEGHGSHAFPGTLGFHPSSGCGGHSSGDLTQWDGI
jgi:uncharacterized protein (DUF433 family)